jgi:hypothetical protein
MHMRSRPDRIVRVPIGPRFMTKGDAGMVTAEFAVVLPAIVVALMVGLVALAAFSARMRCADAAQVAARLAARGESTAAVVAAAERVAPPRASIHVTARGPVVAVTVNAVARFPLLGTLLPGFDVGGFFSQPLEPGPPP